MRNKGHQETDYQKSQMSGDDVGGGGVMGGKMVVDEGGKGVARRGVARRAEGWVVQFSACADHQESSELKGMYDNFLFLFLDGVFIECLV